uniref:Uncharacterized protein n=1 Tax=Aplanochytrium stocchinoi TaxID=215587 RepID=A0A6S8DZG9_9STRA|mmetsp:Transcript_8818/g.11113  ORF Transcript_8818/g.11113 Transcript_8818/m.11113 type:complete len:249 (-) Transcript_8818:1110-1856(-)
MLLRIKDEDEPDERTRKYIVNALTWFRISLVVLLLFTTWYIFYIVFSITKETRIALIKSHLTISVVTHLYSWPPNFVFLHKKYRKDLNYDLVIKMYRFKLAGWSVLQFLEEVKRSMGPNFNFDRIVRDQIVTAARTMLMQVVGGFVFAPVGHALDFQVWKLLYAIGRALTSKYILPFITSFIVWVFVYQSVLDVNRKRYVDDRFRESNAEMLKTWKRETANNRLVDFSSSFMLIIEEMYSRQSLFRYE